VFACTLKCLAWVGAPSAATTKQDASQCLITPLCMQHARPFVLCACNPNPWIMSSCSQATAVDDRDGVLTVGAPRVTTSVAGLDLQVGQLLPVRSSNYEVGGGIQLFGMHPCRCGVMIGAHA
jgi:hypothetical protein